MESGHFDLNSLEPQHRRIVEARIVVNERDRARESEDFARSDVLRKKLGDMGVEVIDQKNGPSGWKFTDGSSRKLPSGIAIPVEAMRKRSSVADTTNSKKRQRNDDHASESTNKPQKLKKDKRNDNDKPEVHGSKEHNRNLSALASVLGSSSANNIQGVLITDQSIGNGPVAVAGKKVKVLYIGKLKSNNKVFDSSTKKPFAFRLGRSEVIRGWDIGVEGMRVGGKRQLVIPPEKAYGRHGAPPTIPGNATLVFDVTLLEVL